MTGNLPTCTNLGNESSHRAPAAQCSAVSPTSQRRLPRLLAIDDNFDSAELITRIAQKCGYDVHYADGVGAASALVPSWQPDVITLDLCMPQDDGIAAFATLAALKFSGRLIIISGHDEWFRKSASRLAFALGLQISADLPKPVDVKELRQSLFALTPSAVSAPSLRGEIRGLRETCPTANTIQPMDDPTK